jgi:hypothetical protein
MPRNRNKRIFSAAVSLLFAMSVAYFAVLPPTSAWFYVNLYDDSKSFTFGTFDFEVPVEYFAHQDIDLPAATKLEDPAESVAFNEAMHIETISATNDGSLPARIYLTVSGNRGTPQSLHYFMYLATDYDAAAAAASENETTSLMDVIRTRKNKFTGLDANIITNGNAGATYTALNAFNFGDGDTGVSDEGNYVVIPPKTTTDIYIAFWADYNQVGDALKVTADVDVHYTYDNIQIKLIAGQDTDGWYYDGTIHS